MIPISRVVIALEKITDYEVYKLAKKSIMKEIATEPRSNKVNVNGLRIGKGIWRKNTTVYQCIECNSFITKADNYCSKCGQKILWEVENE